MWNKHNISDGAVSHKTRVLEIRKYHICSRVKNCFRFITMLLKTMVILYIIHILHNSNWFAAQLRNHFNILFRHLNYYQVQHFRKKLKAQIWNTLIIWLKTNIFYPNYILFGHNCTPWYLRIQVINFWRKTQFNGTLYLTWKTFQVRCHIQPAFQRPTTNHLLHFAWQNTKTIK